MTATSVIRKFKAMFSNKCPRCHRGKFWENGNPYTNLIFNRGRMNENCSKCGLKYEMESGFWYGGMIMSYVINVLLLIFGVLISELVFEEIGIWEEAGLISAFMVLLFPVTFHLSRITWINFFVKYDPGKWQ